MSGIAVNQIRLCGKLLTLDSLRHTPAGIPVVQCRIQHLSTQVEAGYERRIELEVDAQAIGDVSRELTALHLGDSCCVSGFLARKSKYSQQLMLHICSVEKI